MISQPGTSWKHHAHMATAKYQGVAYRGQNMGHSHFNNQICLSDNQTNVFLVCPFTKAENILWEITPPYLSFLWSISHSLMYVYLHCSKPYSLKPNVLSPSYELFHSQTMFWILTSQPTQQKNLISSSLPLGML